MLVKKYLTITLGLEKVVYDIVRTTRGGQRKKSEIYHPITDMNEHIRYRSNAAKTKNFQAFPYTVFPDVSRKAHGSHKVIL